MTPTPLRLFNSYGRELRTFTPIDPGAVRIYSCGPTVYNYAHIGNLRAYVFVDTLRRTLAWKGYNVVHVINITDVGHLTSDADEGDDKMELSAERQQKTVWDIAEHYTQAFKSDLSRLNILPPSLWSKATDHIQEMIDFARHLETHGATYVLEDGVYFDTSKVPDYGKLGLLDVEGQEAGKRVAGVEGKRNPTDFAVWRFSPKDKQRLMEWHTPWGIGAPGWHLECSVMAMKYLGRQFDIHTGGIDHRQVHHCNEIAQNQAFTCSHDTGANWWMHNEFLVLRSEGGADDEKMSKSKGNFLTLQTLIDQGVHPLVYRMFLLTASYRSSLEFSWDALAGAGAHLRRILLKIDRLKAEVGPADWLRVADEARFQSGGPFDYIRAALSEGLSDKALRYIADLDAAVAEDLHTPRALVALGELLDDKALTAEEQLRLAALADLLLGLRLLVTTAADLAIRPADATITEEDIARLIQARTDARKAKDFAQADTLRAQLTEAGVEIKDGPQGTEWEWMLARR